MAKSYKYDIFLSYSTEDLPRVRSLAERLQQRGLQVWFDKWEIKAGDTLVIAIERGLESSQRLVLCLSAAALGSRWVSLERTTAMFRDPANEERRFIPLLLEDCDLPDSLRSKKYVDFRDESDEAFEELVNACSPDENPPDAEEEWAPVGAVIRYVKKTKEASISLDGDVEVGDLLCFGEGEEGIQQRIFSLLVDDIISDMACAGDQPRIQLDLPVRAGTTVYRHTNMPAAEEVGVVTQYDAHDGMAAIKLNQSLRADDEIEIREGNDYVTHALLKRLGKGKEHPVGVENDPVVGSLIFRIKQTDSE